MSAKRLIRSTTVLSIRRDGHVVLAGDGQVTLGEGVIKHTAKKIRRLYQDKILAGFAVSKASWISITATWAGRQWNWPRTGAPISFSGISKRCFWSVTVSRPSF